MHLFPLSFSLTLHSLRFFLCLMRVVYKFCLASGTVFCPPYFSVCYSNKEKMEQDTDVENIKKKTLYQHEKVWSGLQNQSCASHYSSGLLLSNICAENAAFLKNPDQTVRALQLCWCIQGTGASLCHHS